ncbi:MAG: hypothetical protein C5B50_23905 [Verrucomicrobia bacterium]|nr:MAG: hypothetical protein C5B50_23905 [Verrucomicrobiota bacterium]
MHRFYIPPEQCHGPLLLLTGSEAHHAQHVLRIRAGDRVVVLDGAGRQCSCEVREISGKKVCLQVIEERLVPPPSCRMTLLQALPKGKIFEDIIQKATELGVFRIVPLLSEHVVIRVSEREAVAKAAKWRRVAIEAIKQCGAAWLPQIDAPLTVAQFLDRRDSFELPLLASLQPGSRHPREYFVAFETQHDRKPRTACVWVGPEGDFTPQETEAIVAAAGLPITLGPLVLRVETAATYCLAILNYELQDR